MIAFGHGTAPVVRGITCPRYLLAEMRRKVPGVSGGVNGLRERHFWHGVERSSRKRMASQKSVHVIQELLDVGTTQRRLFVVCTVVACGCQGSDALHGNLVETTTLVQCLIKVADGRTVSW